MVFSCFISVVPLSFIRKFDGLFGSVDYQECINLKEIDEESALKKIRKYINELQKLQMDVQKYNLIIAEKMDLYSKMLNNILGNVRDENKQ